MNCVPQEPFNLSNFRNGVEGGLKKTLTQPSERLKRSVHLKHTEKKEFGGSGRKLKQTFLFFYHEKANASPGAQNATKKDYSGKKAFGPIHRFKKAESAKHRKNVGNPKKKLKIPKRSGKKIQK